eukprot:170985_1
MCLTVWCKSRISIAFNRPLLTTEPSTQQVRDGSCKFNLYVVICLASSIAALVIALEYDENTSSCNGSKYTIDLKTFLLCVAGVPIGYFCWRATAMCCAFVCCVLFWENNEVKRSDKIYFTFGNAKINFDVGLLLDLPFLLFWVTWAVIGLVMYSDQMSSDCHEEDVAKMILAWSLIVIIGVGAWSIIVIGGLIYFCCIICCA